MQKRLFRTITYIHVGSGFNQRLHRPYFHPSVTASIKRIPILLSQLIALEHSLGQKIQTAIQFIMITILSQIQRSFPFFIKRKHIAPGLQQHIYNKIMPVISSNMQRSSAFVITNIHVRAQKQ